jgi:hypothetical protein
MPQPLLPLSLDQRGRWVLKVSPGATGLRAHKARPDLKDLPGRRVYKAHLDLLEVRKHARSRRDNLVLLARLDLKDHPDLRGPKDRKVWQDIRVPKRLKVHRDREESLALQGLPDHRVLPVRSGLSDLQAPLVPSALLV